MIFFVLAYVAFSQDCLVKRTYNDPACTLLDSTTDPSATSETCSGSSLLGTGSKVVFSGTSASESTCFSADCTGTCIPNNRVLNQCESNNLGRYRKYTKEACSTLPCSAKLNSGESANSQCDSTQPPTGNCFATFTYTDALCTQGRSESTSDIVLDTTCRSNPILTSFSGKVEFRTDGTFQVYQGCDAGCALSTCMLPGLQDSRNVPTLDDCKLKTGTTTTYEKKERVVCSTLSDSMMLTDSTRANLANSGTATNPGGSSQGGQSNPQTGATQPPTGDCLATFKYTNSQCTQGRTEADKTVIDGTCRTNPILPTISGSKVEFKSDGTYKLYTLCGADCVESTCLGGAQDTALLPTLDDCQQDSGSTNSWEKQERVACSSLSQQARLMDGTLAKNSNYSTQIATVFALVASIFISL